MKPFETCSSVKPALSSTNFHSWSEETIQEKGAIISRALATTPVWPHKHKLLFASFQACYGCLWSFNLCESICLAHLTLTIFHTKFSVKSSTHSCTHSRAWVHTRAHAHTHTHSRTHARTQTHTQWRLTQDRETNNEDVYSLAWKSP